MEDEHEKIFWLRALDFSLFFLFVLRALLCESCVLCDLMLCCVFLTCFWVRKAKGFRHFARKKKLDSRKMLTNAELRDGLELPNSFLVTFVFVLSLKAMNKNWLLGKNRRRDKIMKINDVSRSIGGLGGWTIAGINKGRRERLRRQTSKKNPESNLH